MPSPEPTKRPPKKNMMEAIKILECEIEREKLRALSSQALVDNPPNERVDKVYWQRAATAAIRRVHRLGMVTEWMERAL